MTWIEATCPECGTVECSVEDFELAICQEASASYYSFWCPVCEQQVQKHASERAIELLIAEGVTPRIWSIPEEMLETKDGPAFTNDDLLDFHLLLQRNDWFSELERAVA